MSSKWYRHAQTRGFALPYIEKSLTFPIRSIKINAVVFSMTVKREDMLHKWYRH